MNNAAPATVAYKKVDDALALLDRLPKSPGLNQVVSALVVARGRMQHLERRLGETETMRDRIAMQLIAKDIAGWEDHATDKGILRAYELADRVLELRAGKPPVYEGHFRVGEKVRVKSTGMEGVVDEDIAQHEEYTMVNFRGPHGVASTCLTADLERVGP